MIEGRIDVGDLPARASSIVIFYRTLTPLSPWVKLLETTERYNDVRVPVLQGTAELRAHIRYKDTGRMETRFRGPVEISTGLPVQDRDPPASLTFPQPEIKQEGGVILVTPKVPVGVQPDEYEFEVTETSPGSSDGHAVATISGVDRAEIDMVEGESGNKDGTVHVTPVRKADGVRAATVSKPIHTKIGDENYEFATDFTDAWGTVTVDNVDGAAGHEIVTGALQPKALFAGDDDGVFAGDEPAGFVGDLGKYANGIQITLPEVVAAGPHRFHVGIQPETEAGALDTVYAGDDHDFAGGPPALDANGRTRPMRMFERRDYAGEGGEVFEGDAEVSVDGGPFVPVHTRQYFYGTRYIVRGRIYCPWWWRWRLRRLRTYRRIKNRKHEIILENPSYEPGQSYIQVNFADHGIAEFVNPLGVSPHFTLGYEQPSAADNFVLGDSEIVDLTGTYIRFVPIIQQNARFTTDAQGQYTWVYPRAFESVPWPTHSIEDPAELAAVAARSVTATTATYQSWRTNNSQARSAQVTAAVRGRPADLSALVIKLSLLGW